MRKVATGHKNKKGPQNGN